MGKGYLPDKIVLGQLRGQKNPFKHCRSTCFSSMVEIKGLGKQENNLCE